MKPEIIRTWNKLPYSIELIKEVAQIRFKENCDHNITLNEAIIMCNLIRGVAESNDHYVLMNNSVEIYKAISGYKIKLFNKTLNEFIERRKNRKHKHKIGLIDTPLYTMENWYCFKPIMITNFKK